MSIYYYFFAFKLKMKVLIVFAIVLSISSLISAANENCIGDLDCDPNEFCYIQTRKYRPKGGTCMRRYMDGATCRIGFHCLSGTKL